MAKIPPMTRAQKVDKRCADEHCRKYGVVMMQDRWWCRPHSRAVVLTLPSD